MNEGEVVKVLSTSFSESIFLCTKTEVIYNIWKDVVGKNFRVSVNDRVGMTLKYVEKLYSGYYVECSLKDSRRLRTNSKIKELSNNLSNIRGLVRSTFSSNLKTLNFTNSTSFYYRIREVGLENKILRLTSDWTSIVSMIYYDQEQNTYVHVCLDGYVVSIYYYPNKEDIRLDGFDYSEKTFDSIDYNYIESKEEIVSEMRSYIRDTRKSVNSSLFSPFKL
jgi:hypothetical protein